MDTQTYELRWDGADYHSQWCGWQPSSFLSGDLYSSCSERYSSTIYPHQSICKLLLNYSQYCIILLYLCIILFYISIILYCNTFALTMNICSSLITSSRQNSIVHLSKFIYQVILPAWLEWHLIAPNPNRKHQRAVPVFTTAAKDFQQLSFTGLDLQDW